MKQLLLMHLVALAAFVSLETPPIEAQTTSLSKFFTVGSEKNEYLITSRSQANEIANKFNGPNSPLDHLSVRDRLAMDQLLSLINVNNDEQLCSQEKANSVRDFFLEYIAVRHRQQPDAECTEEDKTKCPRKSSKKQDFRINKLIKKLFIGFGLRASEICRQHMITLLVEDGDELLDESDFDPLRMLTDETSVMAKILNAPGDYDDLRLPKNLARLLNQKQAAGGDSRIYVETASGNVMRRVQLVCRRRFKPIYEKLILPLVTLSSVGFNYKGQEDLASQPDIGQGVFLWYRIVLLCESLNDVEFIENPSIENDQEQQRYVRVMSAFEADCLKMVLAKNRQADLSGGGGGGGEANLGAPTTTDQHVELIVYKPHFESSLFQDEIINVNDARFMRAIRRFKDYQSKLDLIKSKSLRKMIGYVKNSFTKGAVKLADHITGARGNLKNQKDYTNYQIVKFSDEFFNPLEDEQHLDETSLIERTKIFLRLHLVQIIFVSMSVGAMVLISSALSALF